MPPRRTRRGGRLAFSLVEVLLCLFLLVLAYVPTLTLFSSSARAGHAARRRIAVCVQAQSLLEAITQLDPSELLPTPDASDVTLVDDRRNIVAAGAGRWSQVAEFVRRTRVTGMERKVTASVGENGVLNIQVEVEWQAIGGDGRTTQSVCLRGVSMVPTWQ